jgi:phage tail P2-like protein
MISIYDVTLKDLLPDSLKNDPQVQALADALTTELQSISADLVRCILLPRIDELDEGAIDLLAWQLHVDFYEWDLPMQQKRDLVKQSVAWHQCKGTPGAVEQVVSIIFPVAVVKEWFEYDGEPYHFRVETDSALTNEEDLNRLVRMINTTKNTRSWLESVTIKRTINRGSNFSGLLSEYRTAEIYPIAFVMSELSRGHFCGSVVSCWNTTTINPEVD